MVYESHTHINFFTHVKTQADMLSSLMEAQQGPLIGEEVFVRSCAADTSLLQLFPSNVTGMR